MSSQNFSVLLSVYKDEKAGYMSKSLESIFNQSFVPTEVVLVEDGPLTPELYDVIANFVSIYPDKIKSIPLKKNVGLGLALNEGLKACTNNLVARMDTDDIAKFDRFKKQLKVFENNPSFSIVGSTIDEFSDEIDKIMSQRIVPENNEQILEFSKRRNPFNHPTVMYKRDDVLACGGYNNFRRNQDYDLFVRMLNKGYIGYNIQESLLFFRADSNNLNRRKSWSKTKNDIYLRYKFYREGYSSLLDLLIMGTGFIIIFITPDSFFEFINKKFLRKNK